MPQEYPTKVTVEKGIELLLDAAEPVGTEKVCIEDVCGRVLACDIGASENIPPFDRSPLDGYAVRAADIASASEAAPVFLRVIEEVPAGYAAAHAVGEGEAVKILTGAPIPAGADVVIKYEDTEFTDREVRIFKPLKAGSNVVLAGEDVAKGSTIMSRGEVLQPAAVGMLAGLGIGKVCAYRKPTVCIISTGDELVGVEALLQPGKIRNSSAYMLRAFLQQWGVDAQIYGIVRDRQDQIEAAMAECAKNADCVITTGGASVGDYDFVLRAFEGLGAEVLFWKVQMKPGMATLAAKKDGKLFIGLSGNPSAAAAGLFVLCLPAFRKMCGRNDFKLPVCRVLVPEGFDKKSPNGRVLPGRLEFRDSRPCLIAQKGQSNGMISPWSSCSLLGIIPRGTGALEKGSEIDAYLLSDTAFAG